MSGMIRFKSCDGIGTVVIDHPGKRNALTVSMWTELRDLVRRLDHAAEHRCLVFRGAGEDAFAAGADISEFNRERSNREQVTRYHEEYVGPGLAAVLECGIPTIAMIQGACMGGGLEIASVCDIRIAGSTAQFGIPINRMGFPLAFGETELLFKLYGRGVSAELLLEGRIYSAQEAQTKGIVQRVVEPALLKDEVAATAARVAAGSPFAHRRNKEQLQRLLRDWSFVSEAERTEYYDFAETRDYRIGYEAFLQKKTPSFDGT